MNNEALEAMRYTVLSFIKTLMPVKYEFLLKSGMAGLGVLLTHYANSVTPLFWLLGFFGLADLVSGVISASMTTGLSTMEALKGTIKKMCMFILVGIGYGIDLIIQYAKDMAGIELNYPPFVFGILTVCYLLITEGISVLENLSEIGVNVPFLSKTLKAFRQQISKKGETNDADHN